MFNSSEILDGIKTMYRAFSYLIVDNYMEIQFLETVVKELWEDH